MRLLNILVHSLAASAITLSAYGTQANQLYQSNCASCHGSNFEGSGLGPALSPKSYRYGGRESDFERIIREGLVSQGMPSFNAQLTDTQIKDLAKFLPSRKKPKAIKEIAKAKDATHKIPGKVRTLDYLVNIEVVAKGLESPWAIEFPSENTLLVSERSGALRIIDNGKLQKRPVLGIPKILVSDHKWNQGGLLDIALDPDYKNNGWVYMAYSHELEQESEATGLGMIRVVRGKIKDNQWREQEVILEPQPKDFSERYLHYGGRLAFDQQGHLYVTVGDRGRREQAREPARGVGKVHRIYPDGSIPTDNPFINNQGALPSIYSIGHRNPQGLTVEPSTGKIWSSEHGPRGGDEINIIGAGKDYGWPNVSHGINYDGTLVTPHTKAKGVEQPVWFWRPSIAVSGINFYTGDEFPLWQGKLLVTSLKTRELLLLTVDEGRVIHHETLVRFKDRPYEAIAGPDGAIYIALDGHVGKILKITALEERKI